MAGIDTAWADIRAYNRGVIDDAPTMPEAEYGDSEAPTQVALDTLKARRAEERDRLRRDAQLARNADAAQRREARAAKANAPGGLNRNPPGAGPIRDTATTVKVHLDRLAQHAGRAPTPGGLGAVLAGIAFFAFAVIPVNGPDTRLNLIWKALTGNAWLPGTSPSERAQQAMSTIGPIVGGQQNGGGVSGPGGGAINQTVAGLLNSASSQAGQLPGGTGGGPALPPRQAHALSGTGSGGPRALGARRSYAAPYWISSQGTRGGGRTT